MDTNAKLVCFVDQSLGPWSRAVECCCKLWLETACACLICLTGASSGWRRRVLLVTAGRQVVSANKGVLHPELLTGKHSKEIMAHKIAGLQLVIM